MPELLARPVLPARQTGGRRPTELNWRRFFDISSLIAIRVEEPDVFAATPRPAARPGGRGTYRRTADRSSRWPRRSAGLPAPARHAATGSLDRGREDSRGLTSSCRPTGRARVPPAMTLWRPSASCSPIRRRATARRASTPLAGGPGRFPPRPGPPGAKRGPAAARRGEPASPAARQARRAVLDGAAAEDRRAILAELLAAFDVYRAYVVPGEAGRQPARGARVPRRPRPGRGCQPACSLRPTWSSRCCSAAAWPPNAGRRDELIIRFQQTCAAVQAKGVEDTAATGGRGWLAPTRWEPIPTSPAAAPRSFTALRVGSHAIGRPA